MERIAELKTRIAELKTKKRAHDNIYNEGADGYNPHAFELATLEAELDRLEEATADERLAAYIAKEDAEWTREVTMARRADWNAWVKAQTGKITGVMLQNHIDAVGYMPTTLKHHVQRHGL